LTTALIFFLSYGAIIAFKTKKSQMLWLGIAAGMLVGHITLRDIVHDVNWNVMGIFAGTLLLAESFLLSGVPAAVAAYLVRRSSNTGTAFLYVCLLSSFLSIFIENVAVVLIVAPIALSIAKKAKVSPVAVIIGIAIASNLQGTATLIGDPPSMILANFKRMNFNDFFFYKGRLGIFFAVEAGAVVSMAILYLFFRRKRSAVSVEEPEEIRSYLPTVLIAAMIVGLSFSSLFDPDFKWFGGSLCMVLGIACTLSGWTSAEEKKGLLRRYDLPTTAFLAGVFVMVGMLERTGVIDTFADFMGSHIGSNPLSAFLIIVWGSVAFSAFVDNVPYITTMVPVVQRISTGIAGGDELLVFGLLIGACLGGNITPVGASANVVSTGLLRRAGHRISFGRFVTIGLPFTLAATLVGSLVIYLVWGH
jgi:Na+/H+ antiporter NhaD/arsenite permease-like protein